MRRKTALVAWMIARWPALRLAPAVGLDIVTRTASRLEPRVKALLTEMRRYRGGRRLPGLSLALQTGRSVSLLNEQGGGGASRTLCRSAKSFAAADRASSTRRSFSSAARRSSTMRRSSASRCSSARRAASAVFRSTGAACTWALFASSIGVPAPQARIVVPAM